MRPSFRRHCPLCSAKRRWTAMCICRSSRVRSTSCSISSIQPDRTERRADRRWLRQCSDSWHHPSTRLPQRLQQGQCQVSKRYRLTIRRQRPHRLVLLYSMHCQHTSAPYCPPCKQRRIGYDSSPLLCFPPRQLRRRTLVAGPPPRTSASFLASFTRHRLLAL